MSKKLTIALGRVSKDPRLSVRLLVSVTRRLDHGENQKGRHIQIPLGSIVSLLLRDLLLAYWRDVTLNVTHSTVLA
jgi:hypothetical protein